MVDNSSRTVGNGGPLRPGFVLEVTRFAEDGMLFTWDASGSLADRSKFDGAKAEFAYLTLDTKPIRLWIKKSGPLTRPAVWQPGPVAPGQDAADAAAAAEVAAGRAEQAAQELPGAVSSVLFPIYDGGAYRNLIDRTREIVNVADMPGGGEGGVAGDDAALFAAFSEAYSGPLYSRKQIVLGGSQATGVGVRKWNTLRQYEVKEGMTVLGTSKDMEVIPATIVPGGSIFKVSGGRCEIGGLLFAQKAAYGNFDAIQVCKPLDGVKTVHIHDCLATGFRNFVRWQDGDCPRIIKCNGINNKVFINYVNCGVSGYHEDLNSIGGGGIAYDMNPENLHPSSGGRVTGAEGFTYIGCDFLVGTAIGPDGLDANPAMSMKASSFGTFVLTGFSELRKGRAIEMIGTPAQPISAHRFYGCYVLANLGTRQASGLMGIFVSGPVIDILFDGGDINGFPDFGVAFNGDPGNPAFSPARFTFRTTKFQNNGRPGDGGIYCDIFAADVADALMLEGNTFNSSPATNVNGVGNDAARSIYEIRTKIRGSNNYFILPPTLSSKNYNLMMSRGPGAIPGIPGFANTQEAITAGLDAGCWWYDTANGNIHLLGIGG